MSIDEERAAVYRKLDYLTERMDAYDKLLGEVPTAAEVARLRELLEGKKRREWLWDSMKAWSVWIAAVLVGAAMFWDGLKKAVKALGT
jgi:hypothetical protein